MFESCNIHFGLIDDVRMRSFQLWTRNRSASHRSCRESFNWNFSSRSPRRRCTRTELFQYDIAMSVSWPLIAKNHKTFSSIWMRRKRKMRRPLSTRKQFQNIQICGAVYNIHSHLRWSLVSDLVTHSVAQFFRFLSNGSREFAPVAVQCYQTPLPVQKRSRLYLPRLFMPSNTISIRKMLLLSVVFI